MAYTGIGKAADHLDQGICCANMSEKLIAQSLAMARPFDLTGDIDKAFRRRCNRVGSNYSRQLVEPAIGHRDNPNIGLHRTKGIIGCFGAPLGQGIEEC